MTPLFITLGAWKDVSISLLFCASPFVIAFLLCAAVDWANRHLGK